MGRNMGEVAEKVSAVSVVKLHPVIGAEIRGVDLSRPLDADTLRVIKQAWYDHTVLLFRNQTLSEDDQRRFKSFVARVPKPTMLQTFKAKRVEDLWTRVSVWTFILVVGLLLASCFGWVWRFLSATH